MLVPWLYHPVIVSRSRHGIFLFLHTISATYPDRRPTARVIGHIYWLTLCYRSADLERGKLVLGLISFLLGQQRRNPVKSISLIVNLKFLALVTLDA